MSPRRLPRAALSGPAVEVAPSLLGVHLVGRTRDGGERRARIAETEAYEPDDPASHAFGGLRARNATMFEPAGHLYVYLIYGLHHCCNVVTGAEGIGSAVLLRAAEPLAGIDGRDACRGPGRLARAFDVDLRLDGADLVSGETLWLERAPGHGPRAEVVAGPRVGITKASERPWRFWLADDPWVSGSVRSRARPR